MSADASNAVCVLQLDLHDRLLGHAVQLPSGATAVVFDPSFVADSKRPTATLSTLPSHLASTALLRSP